MQGPRRSVNETSKLRTDLLFVKRLTGIAAPGAAARAPEIIRLGKALPTSSFPGRSRPPIAASNLISEPKTGICTRRAGAEHVRIATKTATNGLSAGRNDEYPRFTTCGVRRTYRNSGRWDSNPRRPAWEAGILPLNYARERGFSLLKQSFFLYLSHGRRYNGRRRAPGIIPGPAAWPRPDSESRS